MPRFQITYVREVNLFKDVAIAMPQVIEDILKYVLEEIAKPLAYQLCPKKTKRLAKSIRVIRVRKMLWKLIAGDISVDGVYVDYAYWVERGTHAQSAQPFMGPAMQEAKKTLIQEFKTAARRLKAKIARA